VLSTPRGFLYETTGAYPFVPVSPTERNNMAFMKVRDYRGYKKAVKRAGAKEIATPEQYKLIKQRLRKKYGKTARTSTIEKALGRSGLSANQISRLRGTK